MKYLRLLLSAALTLGVLTVALAADQLVDLYIGGKRVHLQPAARVRGGTAYAPLRATAEALGVPVKWDPRAQTVSLCPPNACAVPIKASRGIMVEGALMMPLALLGRALGRSVTYDAKAQAVRVGSVGG